MVATQSQGRLGCRFVLRPNCSASWAEIKVFLAVISTVCLGVAGAFAWVGLWPILPFAGLEIALLAYALCWTSTRARETEVVDISEQQVAVEKGHSEVEASWRFERSWTQVSLVEASVRNYPTRLFIGSHGQRVQLGLFLGEHERQRLARDLRSVLAGVPISSKPYYEDIKWSDSP